MFGEQLKDFHWVASVRHPVTRLFSVFSFQVTKSQIDASLTASHFEKFCERVFSCSGDLTIQQRIHTWPQTHWLPTADSGHSCSIVRQESLVDDVDALSDRVPTFASAELSHLNRSFEGNLDEYVSPSLARRIEEHYWSDMVELGYDSV